MNYSFNTVTGNNIGFDKECQLISKDICSGDFCIENEQIFLLVTIKIILTTKSILQCHLLLWSIKWHKVLITCRNHKLYLRDANSIKQTKAIY